MPSGTVVIFIEFPIMYWHFDSVLNTSVMVAWATMRVYMFHSHQFHVPVMSPFSPNSRLMMPPWTTSIHLFIHRGILPIESPILRSRPTRRILWSSILRSRPTLWWFIYFRILLLLLLLAMHHPPSVDAGSFTLVPYLVDMGALVERGRGDDAPGGFRKGYLPFDG